MSSLNQNIRNSLLHPNQSSNANIVCHRKRLQMNTMEQFHHKMFDNQNDHHHNPAMLTTMSHRSLFATATLIATIIMITTTMMMTTPAHGSIQRNLPFSSYRCLSICRRDEESLCKRCLFREPMRFGKRSASGSGLVFREPMRFGKKAEFREMMRFGKKNNLQRGEAEILEAPALDESEQQQRQLNGDEASSQQPRPTMVNLDIDLSGSQSNGNPSSDSSTSSAMANLLLNRLTDNLLLQKLLIHHQQQQQQRNNQHENQPTISISSLPSSSFRNVIEN